MSFLVTFLTYPIFITFLLFVTYLSTCITFLFYLFTCMISILITFIDFTPLFTFLLCFSCPLSSFVFLFHFKYLLLYPSTFSSRFIYSLSQYSNCSFNHLFSSNNSLYFDAFHSFAYSLSFNNSSNCSTLIVIVSSF